MYPFFSGNPELLATDASKCFTPDSVSCMTEKYMSLIYKPILMSKHF